MLKYVRSKRENTHLLLCGPDTRECPPASQEGALTVPPLVCWDQRSLKGRAETITPPPPCLTVGVCRRALWVNV